MSKNLKRGGGDACDLNSICVRLHRINGQVSAVERMLNEKRDFIDILQQLVAARQAMDKVATLVLKSEANGCLESNKAVDAKKELNKIATALFKIT
ncbi:MAG: metal-sensitive transcriptional regulator [bacterium]|nr:metal-sensitive transcriptional regulator [bacterium]